MRQGLIASAAILLGVAACGEPVTPERGAEAPAEVAAPVPAAPEQTDPNVAAVAPLTPEGWGPLRIGMTRDEITAALGPDANPNAVGGGDPEQCDQYRPSRAPEGMLVMVEQGRLTRISLIRDSQVKTDRGLGLGAVPSAVLSAYGDSVKAEPHKYESAPAQYLTVWNQDGAITDASRGIRYEVNSSGKVAAIHAGGPSIQYVEGCS